MTAPDPDTLVLDDILLTEKEEKSLSKNEAKQEKVQFDKDKAESEREQQRVNNETKDKKATRSLRAEFAKKAFWYLVGYSIFTAFILILQGLHVTILAQYYSFHLDETLLKILVGSTGVSIIGLVGMILQELFKKE